MEGNAGFTESGIVFDEFNRGLTGCPLLECASTILQVHGRYTKQLGVNYPIKQRIPSIRC